MKDPIERQAAIDILDSYYLNKDEFAYAHARMELKRINTETAGKWDMEIDKYGFTEWRCSLCGGSGRGDYRFCPWCGEKMRREHG